MNVYFDNAATTKVRDEALAAMTLVMTEDYGNPSSLHSFGRRAKAQLEEARGSIAGALGAAPERIYFTSGGTEADNLAIFGTLCGLREKGSIITSAIEHDAVKVPIKRLEDEGWEVTRLLPDSAGRIPFDAFAGALREDTVFASIMLVCNETGAVNPVSEYAAEIKRRALSTVLHTDAVQGFCKIPFSVKSLGADLVSVSSHKLYGPMGAGALYVGAGVRLSAHMLGGGQENNLRAGTQALPAIVGFGEAARLGASELETTAAAVRGLREHTIGLLGREVPGAVVIGEGDSPFILCISLSGFKSEVLMTYLDGEGICVSKGAACKKGARSPVLEAMRLPNDVIDGALRVSFSRYSTMEEAQHFVRVLKKASETLLH